MVPHYRERTEAPRGPVPSVSNVGASTGPVEPTSELLEVTVEPTSELLAVMSEDGIWPNTPS